MAREEPRLIACPSCGAVNRLPPALRMLQGGREVDRIVGAQPKAEITRRLPRLIA